MREVLLESNQNQFIFIVILSYSVAFAFPLITSLWFEAIDLKIIEVFAF